MLNIKFNIKKISFILFIAICLNIFNSIDLRADDHKHVEITNDSTKSTQIIETKDGFTTAIIHTTAECGKCKKTIEKAVNRLDGIKSATLEVETRMFTVVFKNEEIDLAKIKSVINKAGYDADETKAEPKAYDKLPECCKIDGMKK